MSLKIIKGPQQHLDATRRRSVINKSREHSLCPGVSGFSSDAAAAVEASR